jgi:hypothetical protein
MQCKKMLDKGFSTSYIKAINKQDPLDQEEPTMFEPRKITKQMMDFYKTSFDNSFNALLMVQNQMERLASMTMDQTLALPEEAKKVFTDWTKAYKKGCEDYKKAVDDNFKQVEEYFVEAQKAEKGKAATA